MKLDLCYLDHDGIADRKISLLLSVRNWLSVMMKVHRRKTRAKTRVATFIVTKKKSGLPKGTERVNRANGNGTETEMNAE